MSRLAVIGCSLAGIVVVLALLAIVWDLRHAITSPYESEED